MINRSQNNGFLWFLMLCLSIIVCSVQLSYSVTLDVGPGKQIKSLKTAVKTSNPYDTILVDSGNYYENNLVINKPLTIIGRNNPVIDGKFQSTIIVISSDSVSFSGFTIKNVKPSYTEESAGIKVYKSNFCSITDNKIYNTFFGIYLIKSKNCIIKNNRIFGNAVQEFSSGNAIHLWYSDNATIENNYTIKHRDGIYLEFVKNSYITGNESHHNLRYGLHFMFSDSNQFAKNIFKKNGAGVAVMFSRAVNMFHNIFAENTGSSSYGLLLKEIFDSDISYNRFEGNTSGLYAEGATRCKVEKNNFLKNGWAIKIFGSSTFNNFRHNNFISNSFDIASNASINNNKYVNNYWGKYSGYDLNRNGIGDIPYRPVKLFSFISAKSKESLILLRSLFVLIMEFAESITPIFTPSDLNDELPLMVPVKC